MRITIAVTCPSSHREVRASRTSSASAPRKTTDYVKVVKHASGTQSISGEGFVENRMSLGKGGQGFHVVEGVQRRKLITTGLAALALSHMPSILVPSFTGVAYGSELDVVDSFWDLLVTTAKTVMGPGFDAKLEFYSADRSRDFPPGNPAKDFASERRKGGGKCGPLLSGSDRPYAMCPAPGQQPSDLLAQECCRHNAYTYVPEKYYWAKAVAPVPVVVVSPRIRQLDESTWKAILMHELGHCIDFYMFGKSYGLLNHEISDPKIAALLRAESASERDPELRADNFSTIVTSEIVGGGVCYDPVTTVQQLVPIKDFPCEGTGAIDDSRPMLHFTHPPLQGKAPK